MTNGAGRKLVLLCLDDGRTEWHANILKNAITPAAWKRDLRQERSSFSFLLLSLLCFSREVAHLPHSFLLPRSASLKKRRNGVSFGVCVKCFIKRNKSSNITAKRLKLKSILTDAEGFSELDARDGMWSRLPPELVSPLSAITFKIWEINKNNNKLLGYTHVTRIVLICMLFIIII